LAAETTLWKAGSHVDLLLESGSLAAGQSRSTRPPRLCPLQLFFCRWTALAGGDPTVIGDARYSLRTDAFEPIWGVRFHPGAAVPTEWVDFTASNRVPISELWREISGTAAGYRSLPSPGNAR
jgi:hypothetical protein